MQCSFDCFKSARRQRAAIPALESSSRNLIPSVIYEISSWALCRQHLAARSMSAALLIRSEGQFGLGSRRAICFYSSERLCSRDCGSLRL